MRPTGPTFWLLDGRTGWRTLAAAGVSEGRTGLRLGIDPGGPLGFGTADDGLGGLVLPRRIAVDESGTVFLLALPQLRVKRFDPLTRRFQDLPGVGGAGPGARQFARPQAIAVAGGLLYVVDRGHRQVKVFSLETLGLVHLWRLPAARRPTGRRPRRWRPVDVAAGGGAVYLLDARDARVYRHRPRTDAPELVVEAPGKGNRWSRVAADRAGRVYLLDTRAARLEAFKASGEPAGSFTDPGQVADRFDPPVIRLDHRGRFCLPESLSRRCDRRDPDRGPPMEVPLALCPPWLAPSTGGAAGLLFDRQGAPATVAHGEPPGPPLYRTAGTWVSQALDSGVPRCQWHRIELDLPALPAGATVTISTYADQEQRSRDEITRLPEHLWDRSYRATGATQPPPAAPESDRPPADALVQSRGGRYLWLRIQLSSDGYGSPVIEAIRAHFPRESYLEHLPSIFQADDESRRFLEQLLAVFQTPWDELERTLQDMPRLFDPRAVPEGAAMEYLAAWLALPLEGSWSWEQKRRLLEAAPAIYPRRGTVDGLLAYLRPYLANLAGPGQADRVAYPQILEAFRTRAHLQLALEGLADLGRAGPLWSHSVVGRLQLGVYARAGEARLVSTGDPQRELFQETAHRFAVFVPSAWVRTADHEQLVRRAIDAEKPAHTSYELCLVEPRLRVGVQSTVGLDTVVGAYPRARLACRHDQTVPPSRAPRHRLGYDTVLGCTGPGRGARLGAAPRLP
jgi:phage tail-like protein